MDFSWIRLIFTRYGFVRYRFARCRLHFLDTDPSKHFVNFQDVFKTSLRHFFAICLEDVLKIAWKKKDCYTEDAFKTSWRLTNVCLEDTMKQETKMPRKSWTVLWRKKGYKKWIVLDVRDYLKQKKERKKRKKTARTRYKNMYKEEEKKNKKKTNKQKNLRNVKFLPCI